MSTRVLLHKEWTPLVLERFVMPEAGWYEDPSHSDQLRFWDGAAWGQVKDRSPIVQAGARIQSAGNDIAKFGIAFLWIVVGVTALFIIFLLF